MNLILASRSESGIVSGLDWVFLLEIYEVYTPKNLSKAAVTGYHDENIITSLFFYNYRFCTHMFFKQLDYKLILPQFVRLNFEISNID